MGNGRAVLRGGAAGGFLGDKSFFFLGYKTWSWPSSILSPTAVAYSSTAVVYPLSAIGWSCADFADHRTHQLFFCFLN